MSDILEFADALHTSSRQRNLLLGNGFSIAWDYHTFSYESLLHNADFSRMRCNSETLFGQLETVDFEVVIDHLRAADKVVRCYDPGSDIARKAAADADVLRDVLAETLARNHPATIGDITDDAYRSARRFLRHFRSIYTLNYDLLLYWATMKEVDELDIPKNDGFGNDPDDPDADWVTWDVGTPWRQDVHYLHGALHLFDAGDRLKKLTWLRTGTKLLDQIRQQLAENNYPLVVTEGSSSQKMRKILHSGYLTKALRSFSSIRNDLFVYGHSFADNDAHILDAIARGGVRRLFVSIYGDPRDPDNRLLMQRARQLADQRALQKRRPPLDVMFFDARSANAWGR